MPPLWQISEAYSAQAGNISGLITFTNLYLMALVLAMIMIPILMSFTGKVRAKKWLSQVETKDKVLVIEPRLSCPECKKPLKKVQGGLLKCESRHVFSGSCRDDLIQILSYRG